MADTLIPSWGLLIGADLLLIGVFSFLVITKKREPAVTLAWVLAFFLFPLLGPLLYVFFGYQRFRLRRRRTPNPIRLRAETHGPEDLRAALPDELRGVEQLAASLTEYPVTGGNRVRIYERGEETDEALAQAVRGARHHVHMCYYIVDPDRTGRRFRDLLAEQSRRGVRCRLLMDAVGSYGIGRKFLSPLAEAGGQAAFFSPFRVFRLPWAFNFRNHRKLAIIDGRMAFVGSQNIGHHFWRSGSRRLTWRETDVMLEGPAVEELQTVFSEDWRFATGEELMGAEYYTAPEPRGGTLIQVLPTGPSGRPNALALIFLEALHAARERVTVATPYFIPTAAVALALEGAARRGVRVDLLVPRRTDHPVVSLAARSWYKEFLENGVRIHEFGEGFLHSKVVTVDERLALVGSANMDTRSFSINFELSLLLYDRDAAGRLVRDFDRMIADARPLGLKEFERPSLTRELAEGVCRVLSPLL